MYGFFKLLRYLECGIWLYALCARLLCELVHVVVLLLIDLKDDIVVEPGDTFSMLPKSILHLLLLWILEHTESMLFAFIPPAFVLSAIRPVKGALSFLLVIDVFTLILSAIWPRENTLSLHFIVDPIAYERPSI